MTEAILVTEIARLRLEPGDILVVTMPDDATPEQMKHAQQVTQEALRRAGHFGVPLLFKPGNVKLSALNARAEGDTDLDRRDEPTRRVGREPPAPAPAGGDPGPA